MAVWFWLKGEGPDTVPFILSVHLVTRRKLDPDYVATLECVQRVDFVKQDTVILFRLFDPVEVPEDVWVADYASLDDHPELIHYEGHIDPIHHWINVVAGTKTKVRAAPASHSPRRRHLAARLFHRG